MLFTALKDRRTRKTIERTSFECGFIPFRAKKIIFSTNFITIVILFIMFDIEVSIIIPIVIKSSSN
jgi:NADH-ubiquinone oxidoreductase chain 3